MGRNLFRFLMGWKIREEISSAGIEETDSLTTEEEVSSDNSPGDPEGTEISEEDFSDSSTEENSQDTEVAVEDDLQDSAETVQEESSDAVSEELFLSEETQDIFAAEAADNPVYPNEISQDIYWQDNNEGVQAGRLSADEYAAWFYQYGKVEVTYQDSDKTQKTRIMKVSDLLVNGQGGITMEDLEGTGHYVMHFAQGSLKGSLSITGSDGKPIQCDNPDDHASSTRSRDRSGLSEVRQSGAELSVPECSGRESERGIYLQQKHRAWMVLYQKDGFYRTCGDPQRRYKL